MASFDTYLIEIEDDPAGILIRAPGGFAFHAVSSAFSALEGATFPDAYAAERAARRLRRRNPSALRLAA
ncbi:hypothetical protein [Pseudoxanthobacter sp.]|uniref:hypothetical protein n=1 Tax=Pseudoxanthobacter sp. TaxID=1925742 RepID=UPI002FE00F21